MEGLGVFLICYTCGYAAIWNTEGSGDFNGAILDNPAVIFIVISLGADISGAHYNPAVSFTLYYFNLLPLSTLYAYILSQLTGSMLAGLVLTITRPAHFPDNPRLVNNLGQCTLANGISVWIGLFTEIIAAGLLLFTVMHTVSTKMPTYRSAYIVSFLIACNNYAFAGISGCCMNPARTLGLSVFAGRGMDRGWWIYYLGDMLGGWIGGYAYYYLFVQGSDKDWMIEKRRSLAMSSTNKISV